MVFFCFLTCLSPGEIVVNEVNFVRKCISAESSQDDLWGKLICTNFKVSFIPQDAPTKQVFVLTDLVKVKLCCLVYLAFPSSGQKIVLMF